MVWDGIEKRSRASDVERIAVQETLQSFLKQEVDELRNAIIELTKQVTVLATSLSNNNLAINGNHDALVKRVTEIESRQNSARSFIAGASFAFGTLGGFIVAAFEFLMRTIPHHG